MKLIKWATVATMAALPFAALAQQVPQQPSPLDANATVPASTYESAFKDYVPVATGAQAPPDKVWRAANDDIAKSDGHAGHVEPPTTKAPPPASAPAKAAPMDHSKHH